MTSLQILKDDAFDFTLFKNWLGLAGNILAIFFFIAPVSLMKKLHKKEQDPKDIPYFIMLMSIMNCVLWVSYGILKTDDKFFILLANGIGFPINLFYLCLYLFYRSDRDCGKSLTLILPSIIVSCGILAIFTYAINIIEVSQYSAMVFNIFMYGSPGQNIVN